MTSEASWHGQEIPMDSPKPTPEWIIARVISSLGHGFQIDQDPDVRKMILSDWIEDLRDIPQQATEAAFKEWRRSSRSKPTPFDIRRMALQKCLPSEDGLRVERLKWAKSWLEKHETIAGHMDHPQTVMDLLDAGYDKTRLRGAGFTVDDPSIINRNIHAMQIEASQKMRVTDQIKGDAA
ncbi:MAG: hypothetical protein AB8B85_17210 [Paracoccaceae bacterium]